MVLAAALTGCATDSSGPGFPESGSSENADPELRPVVAANGKVISFREDLQFAVIQFSNGIVPDIGRRMGIYRNGKRVGEIKISGPHRNDLTVGDLREGECQPGDEIRPL
jgi:hypothetical protein